LIQLRRNFGTAIETQVVHSTEIPYLWVLARKW
jgi:hypothetical protein